jgi:hypothetical protein
MKKEFGGLGVLNLRELNLCLIGSWVRRYIVDKDKIWKVLVAIKYSIEKPNIFTYKSEGASNFWKCVLWAANVARMRYRWMDVKLGFGRMSGLASLV